MRKSERRIMSFNCDPDVRKEIELRSNNNQKSDVINKLLREALKMPQVVDLVTNSKRYQNIKEVRDFVSEHKYIDMDHLCSKQSLNLGVRKEKVAEYVELLIDEKYLVKNGRYIIDADYLKEVLAANKPIPGSDDWIREQLNKNKKEPEKLSKSEEEKVDAFLEI